MKAPAEPLVRRRGDRLEGYPPSTATTRSAGERCCARSTASAWRPSSSSSSSEPTRSRRQPRSVRTSRLLRSPRRAAAMTRLQVRARWPRARRPAPLPAPARGSAPRPARSAGRRPDSFSGGRAPSSAGGSASRPRAIDVQQLARPRRLAMRPCRPADLLQRPGGRRAGAGPAPRAAASASTESTGRSSAGGRALAPGRRAHARPRAARGPRRDDPREPAPALRRGRGRRWSPPAAGTPRAPTPAARWPAARSCSAVASASRCSHVLARVVRAARRTAAARSQRVNDRASWPARRPSTSLQQRARSRSARPWPAKPAATCVSKTLRTSVPQVRRRIATSWRPACSTILDRRVREHLAQRRRARSPERIQHLHVPPHRRRATWTRHSSAR